jgi:hypothetical protein
MVVGTYGSISYIHLQLEVRKRFYPHIPVLICDDASKRQLELSDLCSRYGADFESNPKRCGHWRGDLTVFMRGLEWAKKNKIDMLLKVSRRWLFLVDWSESLGKLATKSRCNTFGNCCLVDHFPIRTECIGLRVRTWLTQIPSIDIKNPTWVEKHIYDVAKCLGESYGTAVYEVWELVNNNRRQRSPYCISVLANTMDDYLNLSQQFSLKYTKSDFYPER